jgi:hypothetical protein
MPGQLLAVTLREVAGDPEELAALQRVMESDEGFALRVTGHPPGPADAQSTLMFVPEGRSPDDNVAFGVWVDGALVGILDLLLRYPDDETLYRSSASGAAWASPRPARSAPGATTSSGPRRS